MSTRPRRGRTVHPQKQAGSLRNFYILIGVIIVIGVVALAAFAFRSPPTAAPSGVVPNTPPSTAPTGITEEGFNYKGQADAPVVVTEFADFQCPGCGYFATNLERQFERDYVETGKVKFVFHDYPLQGHPNAIPAAEAARCAGDQNAFWSMKDLLFTNQRQWSALNDPTAQFLAYAKQLSLDEAAFTTCVSQHKYQSAITQAQAAGEQLLLPGTPSFAVNGTLVDTTGLDTVDQIVNRVRQQVDAVLATQ